MCTWGQNDYYKSSSVIFLGTPKNWRKRWYLPYWVNATWDLCQWLSCVAVCTVANFSIESLWSVFNWYQTFDLETWLLYSQEDPITLYRFGACFWKCILLTSNVSCSDAEFISLSSSFNEIEDYKLCVRQCLPFLF